MLTYSYFPQLIWLWWEMHYLGQGAVCPQSSQVLSSSDSHSALHSWNRQTMNFWSWFHTLCSGFCELQCPRAAQMPFRVMHRDMNTDWTETCLFSGLWRRPGLEYNRMRKAFSWQPVPMKRQAGSYYSLWYRVCLADTFESDTESHRSPAWGGGTPRSQCSVIRWEKGAQLPSAWYNCVDG